MIQYSINNAIIVRFLVVFEGIEAYFKHKVFSHLFEGFHSLQKGLETLLLGYTNCPTMACMTVSCSDELFPMEPPSYRCGGTVHIELYIVGRCPSYREYTWDLSIACMLHVSKFHAERPYHCRMNRNS